MRVSESRWEEASTVHLFNDVSVYYNVLAKWKGDMFRGGVAGSGRISKRDCGLCKLVLRIQLWDRCCRINQRNSQNKIPAK